MASVLGAVWLVLFVNQFFGAQSAIDQEATYVTSQEGQSYELDSDDSVAGSPYRYFPAQRGSSAFGGEAAQYEAIRKKSENSRVRPNQEEPSWRRERSAPSYQTQRSAPSAQMTFEARKKIMQKSRPSSAAASSTLERSQGLQPCNVGDDGAGSSFGGVAPEPCGATGAPAGGVAAPCGVAGTANASAGGSPLDQPGKDEAFAKKDADNTMEAATKMIATAKKKQAKAGSQADELKGKRCSQEEKNSKGAIAARRIADEDAANKQKEAGAKKEKALADMATEKKEVAGKRHMATRRKKAEVGTKRAEKSTKKNETKKKKMDALASVEAAKKTGHQASVEAAKKIVEATRKKQREQSKKQSESATKKKEALVKAAEHKREAARKQSEKEIQARESVSKKETESKIEKADKKKAEIFAQKQAKEKTMEAAHKLGNKTQRPTPAPTPRPTPRPTPAATPKPTPILSPKQAARVHKTIEHVAKHKEAEAKSVRSAEGQMVAKHKTREADLKEKALTAREQVAESEERAAKTTDNKDKQDKLQQAATAKHAAQEIKAKADKAKLILEKHVKARVSAGQKSDMAKNESAEHKKMESVAKLTMRKQKKEAAYKKKELIKATKAEHTEGKKKLEAASRKALAVRAKKRNAEQRSRAANETRTKTLSERQSKADLKSSTQRETAGKKQESNHKVDAHYLKAYADSTAAKKTMCDDENKRESLAKKSETHVKKRMNSHIHGVTIHRAREATAKKKAESALTNSKAVETQDEKNANRLMRTNEAENSRSEVKLANMHRDKLAVATKLAVTAKKTVVSHTMRAAMCKGHFSAEVNCQSFQQSTGCVNKTGGGNCHTVFFPGTKQCASCVNGLPLTKAMLPHLHLGASEPLEWCYDDAKLFEEYRAMEVAAKAEADLAEKTMGKDGSKEADMKVSEKKHKLDSSRGRLTRLQTSNGKTAIPDSVKTGTGEGIFGGVGGIGDPDPEPCGTKTENSTDDVDEKGPVDTPEHCNNTITFHDRAIKEASKQTKKAECSARSHEQQANAINAATKSPNFLESKCSSAGARKAMGESASKKQLVGHSHSEVTAKKFGESFVKKAESHEKKKAEAEGDCVTLQYTQKQKEERYKKEGVQTKKEELEATKKTKLKREELKKKKHAKLNELAKKKKAKKASVALRAEKAKNATLKRVEETVKKNASELAAKANMSAQENDKKKVVMIAQEKKSKEVGVKHEKQTKLEESAAKKKEEATKKLAQKSQAETDKKTAAAQKSQEESIKKVEAGKKVEDATKNTALAQKKEESGKKTKAEKIKQHGEESHKKKTILMKKDASKKAITAHEVVTMMKSKNSKIETRGKKKGYRIKEGASKMAKEEKQKKSSSDKQTEEAGKKKGDELKEEAQLKMAARQLHDRRTGEAKKKTFKQTEEHLKKSSKDTDTEESAKKKGSQMKIESSTKKLRRHAEEAKKKSSTCSLTEEAGKKKADDLKEEDGKKKGEVAKEGKRKKHKVEQSSKEQGSKLKVKSMEEVRKKKVRDRTDEARSKVPVRKEEVGKKSSHDLRIREAGSKKGQDLRDAAGQMQAVKWTEEKAKKASGDSGTRVAGKKRAEDLKEEADKKGLAEANDKAHTKQQLAARQEAHEKAIRLMEEADKKKSVRPCDEASGKKQGFTLKEEGCKKKGAANKEEASKKQSPDRRTEEAGKKKMDDLREESDKKKFEKSKVSEQEVGVKQRRSQEAGSKLNGARRESQTKKFAMSAKIEKVEKKGTAEATEEARQKCSSKSEAAAKDKLELHTKQSSTLGMATVRMHKRKLEMMKVEAIAKGDCTDRKVSMLSRDAAAAAVGDETASIRAAHHDVSGVMDETQKKVKAARLNRMEAEKARQEAEGKRKMVEEWGTGSAGGTVPATEIRLKVAKARQNRQLAEGLRKEAASKRASILQLPSDGDARSDSKAPSGLFQQAAQENRQAGVSAQPENLQDDILNAAMEGVSSARDLLGK